MVNALKKGVQECFINPHKTSVLFVGHRLTIQTRDFKLLPYTCTPKIRNGFVQLIRVRNPIRHKWV